MNSMDMMAAASNLDLRGWLRGLIGAGIAGGAAAVGSSTLVTGLAPDTFNFYDRKIYILIAGMFILSGITSIAKFLAGHPLPDDIKTVTTAVATEAQAGQPLKVTTTVQETHTVPVVPTPPSAQDPK
jgi:hypothetical protein